MRRARFILFVLVFGLALPALTWSQGPGGGFGKRGIAADPDKAFDLFSGGKDVIVVSELPQDKQIFAKGLMARYGVQEDRITRDRFREIVSLNVGKSKGAGAGMAPPPGEKTPVAAQPGENPAPTGKLGSREERTDAYFRKLDTNKDGLLSADEIPENMQQYREKFDSNRDGFIDLTEFKAFTAVMYPPREAPSSNTTTEREPVATPNVEAPRPAPDPVRMENKPTIYRAGKLPPGLPEWFARLDKEGDCDGQVGLWEARNDKSVLDNFAKMDLNGDGLLTADEVLRYYSRFKKKPDEAGAANQQATSASPSNQATGYLSPFPTASAQVAAPAVTPTADLNLPPPTAAVPSAGPSRGNFPGGGRGEGKGPPANGDWRNMRRGGNPQQ